MILEDYRSRDKIAGHATFGGAIYNRDLSYPCELRSFRSTPLLPAGSRETLQQLFRWTVFSQIRFCWQSPLKIIWPRLPSWYVKVVTIGCDGSRPPSKCLFAVMPLWPVLP